MIGSRPDLAFIIVKLSQHAETPSIFHCDYLKRGLRYDNGTKDYGILFDSKKQLVAEGFSGADWANFGSIRKSTSGFFFLVARGAVSWKSVKKTWVSTLTYETE